MNYKESAWVLEEDFVYSTELVFSDEQLAAETLNICFYGIDTFSEIYLNGEKLGETDNMFLKYVFPVKEKAKRGANRLEVRLRSTIEKMKTFDCKDYFGTFNVPRIFVRKAQCHFGWDWAPKLPGYGIWQNVSVEWGEAVRIESVSYVSDVQGNLTFHVQTTDVETKAGEYTLTVKVAKEPFGDPEDGYKKQIKLVGGKKFINFKIEDRKLWWPVGYGDANLYPFKVCLNRDEQELDRYQANCAFREIALDQKPIDAERLSFVIRINGAPVYVKGSNWVPIECFTGVVQDEKYEKMIRLARDGNFNLLRVWGGGIYEKDIFYELCDKMGLMVWQDFMFACADIPEKEPGFIENVMKECRYQIKRLINHPSLVYWCGGNEKTGTYGKLVSHGDFFCDNILHGLVKTMDPSRPYVRQSPYSHTDVGNDLTSGESHCNSCEEALEKGMRQYRKFVSDKKPSFVSECAIMGPSVKETLQAIFPADKMWPMNEYWYDRFMDNPYASYVMPFAERELLFATKLYGAVESVDDFIAKANSVHAELMQAEMDYARSRKWECAGFLNWMYGDIWPSGTWAIVDYFLRPKQAYYRMKACFAPVRAMFVYENGHISLYAVYDGNKSYRGKIEYGEKTLEGEIVWAKTKEVDVTAGNALCLDTVSCEDENYLFAVLTDEQGNKQPVSLYSPTMWSGCKFRSDYKVEPVSVDGKKAIVRIKANGFAKGVYLSFPNNEAYLYSDNFVDVQAGEEVLVEIASEKEIDLTQLRYCDFATPCCRKGNA